MRAAGWTARPCSSKVRLPGGYGEKGFQPSALFFPTEGCWEVTGRVRDATLTFVTIVVKASNYALEETKR